MIRLVVRGGQQEITAQAPTLDQRPPEGWHLAAVDTRTGCGGTGNGDRHVVIEDPASPEQPVQVGARPTFSKIETDHGEIYWKPLPILIRCAVLCY